MSVEDPNRWIEWQNSIRGRTVPRTELAQAGQAGSTTTPDFLWIITAIARLYAQDNVLEMQQLDNYIKDSLGEGTTFRVSSVEAPSTTLSHKTANKAVHKRVKVVLKQTPPGVYQSNGTVNGDKARGAAASLLMELRILGHPEIRAHANIVNLLGIGWQYSGLSVLSPHPIPILEQASSDLATFQSNNRKLPYKTKRTICLDVARGLQALHDSGVVHCDIKPKNILVFEEEHRCVAKVTDFSLSILDTGAVVSIGGRTPGYNAPEWEKSMSFADAKRTDTYSYGVLFAAVMVGHDVVQAFYDGRPHRLDDAESREKALELMKANNEFRQYVLTLLRNTDDSDVFATEDSLNTIALQRSVLECTLELDPLLRDLDKAISLLEQGQPAWRRTASPNSVAKVIEDDILSVPYQSLNRMSRILKKQIVDALEYVAKNSEEDPSRSAAACYELCVCNLTGFGVPINNNAAAAWIIEAGHRGEKFAKSIVYHVLSSLGTLDVLGTDTMETWLCEAAGLGSWAALQGLEAMNSVHLAAATTDHRHFLGLSRFEKCRGDSAPGLHVIEEMDEVPRVSLHEDARLGNAKAFRSERIREQSFGTDISVMINQKDHNGDTPLLCASRSGRNEIVSMLLDLGADVSLVNDFGENSLHFLLCLRSTTTSTLRSLAESMFERGVDWTAHANDSSMSGEYEQGLIIAGCPRTRAANFNAPQILDLLYTLIDERQQDSTNEDKRESALARRLIAFACRSHHHEILEVLARHRPEEFNDGILKDNWLWNNGRKYSLPAFAINGCVASHTVASAELPEKFWRVLNHGTQSIQALEKTLTFLGRKGIDFCSTPDGESKTALAFAIRSSNLDAVNFLLRLFSEDDMFTPFGTGSSKRKKGLPNHREKIGLVDHIREAISCGQLDIFNTLLRWNDHEALKMGNIVHFARKRWYWEKDARDCFPSHVSQTALSLEDFEVNVVWKFNVRSSGDKRIAHILRQSFMSQALPPLVLRGGSSLRKYLSHPYSDGTLNYSLLYMMFIAEAEHRDIEFAEALLSTKIEFGMTKHYKWRPRNKVELASFAHVFETPLFIAAYNHWTELVNFLMRHGADLRAAWARNSFLTVDNQYGSTTILSIAMRSKDWESVNVLLTSANEQLRDGIKPQVDSEMKTLLSRSESGANQSTSYEVTKNLISNFKALEVENITSRLNHFVTKAAREGKEGILRALLEHGCSVDGAWSSWLSYTPFDYVCIHQIRDHQCGTQCAFLNCAVDITNYGGHRRGLLSSLEFQLALTFWSVVLALGLIPATYYSFILVNNWHLPYFVNQGKRVEASSSGPAKFWITVGVWFSFFAYAFPLLIGFGAVGLALMIFFAGLDWWETNTTADEVLGTLLFPYLRFLYTNDRDLFGVLMSERSIKRDWDYLYVLSVDIFMYIISCGRVSRFGKSKSPCHRAFGRRTPTLPANQEAKPP